MDNSMIGMLFVLGVFLVIRVINERAIKTLSQDKKAELIDLFSKDRIYNLVIVILLIGLLFLNTKYKLVDSFLSLLLYSSSIMIFIVVVSFLAYRKLKKNQFPDSFLKSFILTSTFKTLALLFFLRWIIYR